MPLVSKRRFNDFVRGYVQPCISDMYFMQKADILNAEIERPLTLSLDGQFDSPGYVFSLGRKNSEYSTDLGLLRGGGRGVYVHIHLFQIFRRVL